MTIAYDDADRRTSITYPNTNKVEYLYNVASELTTLTYKQGTTTLGTLTYTYDAAGNRIKTGGTFARSNLPPALASASYNANNQQTAFGASTQTYDLNGNLATTTDAGVTTTYTWNTRNQLTSIRRTGFTASFTYDSFGRRTGRTVNGTVTNYVYDGLNPVQEKNGVTVTANLLTGLGIDEFFTRTDSVGVRSLLPDALGSTVALGDGTGVLQTQYSYEPFGFTTQTGAANTNSYKYTGREDDGTGLYYYRTRYYYLRLQRFTSEDPIGFVAGDINFYVYTGNDPIRFLDYDGLTSSTAVGALSGMGISEMSRDALSAIGSAAAVTGGTLASILLFPDDVGAGSDIIPYPDSDMERDIALPPSIILPGGASSCPADPYQYEEHRKNKQKKNWDKHTKPRPGRDSEKKKQHLGWNPNPNKRRP